MIQAPMPFILSGPEQGMPVRLVSAFDTMIHIGHLIREELIRQERTPSWLAKKINCERTNVYDIFERSSINTELLERISAVLKYDFFALYSRGLSGDDVQ